MPRRTNADWMLETDEFEDAYEGRPRWASEAYRSEYLAHLLSVGWTPRNHVWEAA